MLKLIRAKHFYNEIIGPQINLAKSNLIVNSYSRNDNAAPTPPTVRCRPFIRLRLWLALVLLIPNLIYSGLAERKSLEADIADGYLDDYSKIEAAFILSGVTHPDSLQRYLDWYGQLLAKIKTFPFESGDPVGSAKTVFIYLHATWLKTYALESTTLADIARNKEYNCVAATILYNIICEDLQWSCEAFETPTHVYTIFKNFGQNLIVENTNNMGFDIMSNLKAYSRYLAQFYPESDVLRIGLDKLYYHENSKGRVITNTELLGLLAYNRAYLAKKNNDYKRAYDYVLLAQQFNRDSRSNVNFEMGLYYSWGKQLFLKNDFMTAFTVFADGYYRYPDNKDFLKNTFASFYNGLQLSWQRKSWPECVRLIEEMLALEILQEGDRVNIKQLLNNWLHYFESRQDGANARAVSRLLEML
jgi:hypothetical protein